MTSTAILARNVRSGAAAKARDQTTIVSDSLTQTTAIALENHSPEIGTPTDTPAIAKHPSSGSALNLASDKVYNGSGSATGLYFYTWAPSTVDYTVYGRFVVIGNTSGNGASITARMSDTQNTYYQAQFSPGTNFAISLKKVVSGTATVLATKNYYTGSLPSVNDVFELWLAVSNDEKVVYVKGPEDSFPVRWVSSGDNAIPTAGFGGLSFLRCPSSNGQHLTAFDVYENGPQEPTGTGSVGTPDPIQAPAVLFEPDYSIATDTVPWFREQEPYVRGVKQTTRMRVVTGTDIPGSGVYKPTGALRVEIRPFKTDADFAVHLTTAAASTTAQTTVAMSAEDVALLSVLDALKNETTGEFMRVSSIVDSTHVVLNRAQHTAAAAIATTDDLTVFTGDVNDSGNVTSAYFTSRGEVYDRFPQNPDGSGNGSAPAASWPDPAGSVRWYGISAYCDPSNYPTSQTGNPWGPIHTQFKGQFGGSPPRSMLEHKDGHFWLGGTRPFRDLGPIPSGIWNRYVVGIRWDTQAVNGWTECWVNGVLKQPKAYEATMDKLSSGNADPIYLKDGIYRSSGWASTHIVYLGPIKVGTTRADVMDP